MKTFDFKASLRQDVGKKATKQLRKDDKVPCVLYGGENPIHFAAPSLDFRHLVYTPSVYLVNLDLDGQMHQAVIQDIQFHPVSDKILHVDFLQVSEGEPIKVNIPVVTEGFAKGVQAGGKLKIEMRRLKVKALSKHLPDDLVIDVTNIGLGTSIKVRDLKFDDLELLDPRNSVVISVKLTRVAKGMAVDEEEEGEESEGEGEDGAADSSEGEEATE